MKVRQAVFAVSLLIGGCGGMAEQLKGVQAVQSELVRVLREESISVKLVNDRFLTISLINSQLKALIPEQKAAKVFEIAGLAYEALPQRQQLERIDVVFVEQKTYFVFFHSIDGRDSYFVDPREFRGGMEKDQSGSKVGGEPLPSETASAKGRVQ